MDHAVGELNTVELGTRPFHARVGGAFEEVDVVLAREAHEVLHREDELLVDETVDHQTVLGRVDMGRAAVVTFEADTVGGDDAI